MADANNKLVCSCTIDQMKRQQGVDTATVGTSKEGRPIMFFGTTMVTLSKSVDWDAVKANPKNFVIRRYEEPEAVDGTGLTSILGKALCEMTDETI